MLNYVEVGQKRSFLHLLLSKKPVAAEDIQRFLGDFKISVNRISQIMREINLCLINFSESEEGLNSPDVIVRIPERQARGTIGYYLACYKKDENKYLAGKEASQALWDVNKNRIASILRKQLKKEAKEKLAERLRGVEYQDLGLEYGSVPERDFTLLEYESDLKLEQTEQLGNYGRIWHAFKLESLESPDGVYILSCNTGTGKTTFLRNLQKIILSKKINYQSFYTLVN